MEEQSCYNEETVKFIESKEIFRTQKKTYKNQCLNTNQINKNQSNRTINNKLMGYKKTIKHRNKTFLRKGN